jgi:hypothetical protein
MFSFSAALRTAVSPAHRGAHALVPAPLAGEPPTMIG